MSLHSYSSVVKRIDQRGGPLERFLSLPRHAMVLSSMNRPQDVSQVVQQGVQELAVRTARCYLAFSNPIFTRSVQRANAGRLKWVKTYSLREFKYCVALQDAVAQFVEAGGVTCLASSSSPAASFPSVAFPASSPPPAAVSPEAASCFVRNTDDRTYVDETAAAAAAKCKVLSSKTPFPSTAGVESSPPSAARDPVGARASSSLPFSSCAAAALSQAVSSVSVPTAHDRVMPIPPASIDAASFIHVTRKGPMTREEAELALETGDLEVTDLPFDLALEMLRPQESVVDVLVNEAALQSEQLNRWFSHFCRRRVAWRVLHEHLLHLIRPDLNTPVVWDATDVVELLQNAGNTVADIYAKLNVSDSELIIHLEEDPSILTTEPQAAFTTSSTDCLTRSCENGLWFPRDSPARQAPPPSATVYSVEGHLAYVFREVLKNACVATVRWTSDVSLLVRFAVDDQWVVVDFIDHAGGIAPEYMRDIWKFGWTTSEHYESHLGGFGVGLPTSKVYMDMWGGSIDVYSTVGKGTTVRVRYPKAPTEVLVMGRPDGAPSSSSVTVA